MARPIKIVSLSHKFFRNAFVFCGVSVLLFGGSDSVHGFARGHSGSAHFDQTDPGRKNPSVGSLELGKPIEQDLAGAQTHSFQIALVASQYLRVHVEKKGIEVVVTLFAPDEKAIAEVDSPNRTYGLVPIVAVAEVSGDYRLEVHAATKESAAGRYEVKLEERRPATPMDATRVAAQQALAEGRHLRSQSRVESMRKAIDKFEEALPLWRAVRDRRGEAETLLGAGWLYADLGEKQKGLDHLISSLSIWRELGDRSGEAFTLHRLGVVYGTMGEPSKALDYFKESLTQSRAVADRRVEAEVLQNFGGLYSTFGENQKALDYLNQSLSAIRLVGDRRVEAQTLNLMGVVYSNLGENSKTIDYYEQALALRRAVGDRAGEAQTLNNLGVFHRNLGEERKAIEFYSQALALRRAVGDRQGEANTLHNMGAAYADLGEYQKALEAFHQALLLWRATEGRRGEAFTLQQLAQVFRRLGEPQKAVDYYTQALPLWRGVGDRRGEALTLNGFGWIYDRLGEKQKALDYYTQALTLNRTVSDPRGQAETLNNIASIYSSLPENQKALDYHQQALALTRSTSDRFGEAVTLDRLGAVYAGLGQSQKALDSYQQALSLQRAIEDRNGESITLAAMARLERDGGHLAEARDHIESALRLVESLRTKISVQELQTSFFASKQSSYEFYIDLLMRLHKQDPTAGHDRAALEASERARGRSLLDTLAEIRADLRQGADPSLVEREQRIQELIAGKAERLTRLLNGKHTPQQAAEANKELEAIWTQYQEVRAQIRAQSPRYAALTLPVPLDVEKIQHQVLDAETLLLEFALGGERSFLWAVTATTVSSFELPPRAEIEAASRRVYDLLSARNQDFSEETLTQRRTRVLKADAEFLKDALALSRMLLGPVATQLGTKRLLIVSEGALQFVPLGALPAPTLGSHSHRAEGPWRNDPLGQNAKADYRPLLLDHEIVTLPSASVLAVLRQELAGRAPAEKMLVVLADPVFQSDDPRVKLEGRAQDRETNGPSNRSAMADSAVASRHLERSGSESGVRYFKRLRFSRYEADQIAALVSREKSLEALDFKANRATANSPDLSHYRFVHFATHSLLNTVHPAFSGIVLSLVDERGGPQDGFLRLYEIYNLKLQADLVVLSACQTALGKEIKGEGLVGLTRGFMYAGAPRVIASLWSVEDKATAELMKRFYEGMLKEGLRPAAALRAAQVALWKQKRWEAPYYWTAFILQGEWK